MSLKAEVRRNDQRNFIRRANRDDLDTIELSGIGENLTLHEEVTHRAVVMGNGDWGGVSIRAAIQRSQSGAVIQAGKRMQGRAEGKHPTIEGGSCSDQDLPSKPSHPVW
jgi:hypothetical protein